MDAPPVWFFEMPGRRVIIVIAKTEDEARAKFFSRVPLVPIRIHRCTLSVLR